MRPFGLPIYVARVPAAPFASGALQRFNGLRQKRGSLPSIQLEQVVSGLTQPTTVTNAGDGTGRIFIAQETGQIMIFINGSVLPTPFLDISDLVRQEAEQGLLGLAFPSDYAEQGFFFVDYTDRDGNIVVARYQVSDVDPNVADPDSALTILKQPQGLPLGDHNGGTVAFGPDGYLYISIGDGSCCGDPGENGQDLQTWLGKILRVDINRDDFPGDPDRNYGVPPDNPFVGQPPDLPEIWAYGVRNPWRCSFDRATGDFFIADVGQDAWEEVNFQPSSSTGGENYGWSVLEGVHCFNNNPSCDDFINGGSTLPILEYNHNLGCSISGGYRYRGQSYPDLEGIYFYADFCTGRIWGATQQINGTWESQELLGAGFAISTFGEDETGELYVVEYNFDQSVLYRITSTQGSSPTPTPSSTPVLTPTPTPVLTPTPTPMLTPTPTPVLTPTPTSTPPATPSPTATATSTVTPTSTPRPTPTPRGPPTPRARPTPHSRPTP